MINGEGDTGGAAPRPLSPEEVRDASLMNPFFRLRVREGYIVVM